MTNRFFAFALLLLLLGPALQTQAQTPPDINDDCYEYYEDTTCDDQFDEHDPSAGPSIGCSACDGSTCTNRKYSSWENSTSNIPLFSSTGYYGYFLVGVGYHACRTHYECPGLCVEESAGNYVCQDSYTTGSDSIAVWSEGAECSLW